MPMLLLPWLSWVSGVGGHGGMGGRAPHVGQGEGRQPEYGEALMLPGQDVLSEVDLVCHGEQQLQELAATVSSSAGREVAASPCKVAGTYEDKGCPLGPRCQRTKAEGKGHGILAYAGICVVHVVFQSVLGSLVVELAPPQGKNRRLYTEWVRLLA